MDNFCRTNNWGSDSRFRQKPSKGDLRRGKISSLRHRHYSINDIKVIIAIKHFAKGIAICSLCQFSSTSCSCSRKETSREGAPRDDADPIIET